ncbi:carboxypeptidase-like regulatory domain-containing protein [Candidatus Kryptonium thompsonii]|uniref:carboxypeptidase-like regulatory domain-containing protein n=1 Tax=Candidatus Kryptonium thompsonii TaxID=1633631 RepID=UPI00063E80EC|nr:carboxypeptidase-like regulatory domain-containing protein [Candidatus Kryptonium thompsoni]CUT02686.1 Carboxypeptidase regulatory-like domain-containing protein [Candidatus Kryptonium thompsoni]
MKNKVKFLISVLLLLISVQLVFAQYGKISGRVVDRETKEPLPGASVVVQGTTLGAATDVNGNYVILNVPAGTYTVVASYVGYQTVTVSGVQVIAGLTRELNFELPSTAIELRAVEVVAERPLIEKSATNAIRVVTSADVEKLPVRDVNVYFALQAGVSLQYGRLYIRGSRSDEVGYMIEGGKCN